LESTYKLSYNDSKVKQKLQKKKDMKELEREKSCAAVVSGFSSYFH